MIKKDLFFKRCKVWWRKGFYIPVRNDFSNNLEKRYISESEKEKYESQFGVKILFDEEFFQWLKSIRN